MQFTMFTLREGFKIGVNRADVLLVSQDPESPEHSLLMLRNTGEVYPEKFNDSASGLTPVNLLYHIDEDFHTAISRLNTIAS